MDKMLRTFIMGLLLTGVFAPAGFTDYDDLGEGARAIGMGNAFSAICDDPFGMYYNPAGLGYINQAQLGADYGKLWMGLSDNSDLSSSYAAYILPVFVTKRIENSSLGALNLSTGTPSVDVSSNTAGGKRSRFDTKVYKWGTFGLGYQNFALSDHYQESAYYLSFGRSPSARWSWGVNLKYLVESYVMDEYLVRSPVFDYGNKTGVTAFSGDIGMLYNILPRLFLAASIKDINEPNLGLLETDRLPATVRLGLGWKQKDLNWDVDLVSRRNLYYEAAGVEKWIVPLFALRGGLMIGGNNYMAPGMGFSFNLGSAQIDYAFQYPLGGIKDTSGNHRMSFVYRFGNKQKDMLDTGSLEYYYAELQEKNKNLESNLADTMTENDKLKEILVEEATARIRERIKAAKLDVRDTRPAQSAPKEEKAAESPQENRYVVKLNDTLQSIALKYYGDAKYWNEIFQINRASIGRGGSLQLGQVLIVPKLKGGMDVGSEVSKAPVVTETPVSRLPAATSVQSITPTVVVPVNVQPVGPVVQKQEIIPVQMVPVVLISTGGTANKGIHKAALPGMGSAKTAAHAAAAEKPQKLEAEQKEETEQPEPKRFVGPRKHTVQPGENLRIIAQKYYNDPERWKDIYKANKDKIVGGQIMPGLEITIPPDAR